MRRRPRIIAAVVTVAALACVVPVWEDVWLWVRYERHDEFGKDGMYYLEKRWEWVAGGVLTVPEQACASCRSPEHPGCVEDIFNHLSPTPWLVNSVHDPRSQRPWHFAGDVKIPFSNDWRCTCPTCHPERER